MNNWRFPYYNHESNKVDWEGLDKLDWIKDMHGVEQDPIWHAEGDVYVHTKMAVEALITFPEFIRANIEQQHMLVAAMLLHDVEKRSTSTVEDGRIRSHHHARKGAATANVILYKDIPTPLKVRIQICGLIRYHGLPINILDKPDPNRAVIESSLLVNNYDLATIAKADILGRIADDNDEQLEHIAYFLEYCRDNSCTLEPKAFDSPMARYKYLSDKSSSIYYVPHDETKFTVVLMSGIAGSGKDYTIKNSLDNWPVVSLDNIRRENKISPSDKQGNGRVIQMAKEMARGYMRQRSDFIWNATNLTKQMRQQLVELFMSYGAKVIIIYVEKPYKILLEQNKNREHVVPEPVIEKMIHKVEVPTFDEAHNVIYADLL